MSRAITRTTTKIMSNTMLYVIAYDLSDDKRRTKVHKILSGFGQWTQFSLFECFLSPKEHVKLRAQLDAILDEDADRVRFYPVCAMCQSNIETIGSDAPHEHILFLV